MTKRKKVTSTYRREFSPERSASRPSIIRSFDANFNYREYRRQVEHGHHRSPFVWEDWEYELPEQYNIPSQPDTCCRKASKKIQVKTQLSDSGSSGDLTNSDDSVNSNGHRPPPSVPQARVGKREQVPADSDVECNCGAEQRRVKGQGQPARVLSDTISKSLKKVSKRSAQPDLNRSKSAPVDDSPFVQFGTGDEEQETGNKRTHNVLSRQGVYPAAVEAKSRLKTAKELRHQQPIREVYSKTTLHDPDFDNKMNRQTTRWQSEYNKHYRQYPTVRYH